MEVAESLCLHPDLGVRIELAVNRWALKSVLQRLAEDADPDIANAGRESLAYD